MDPTQTGDGSRGDEVSAIGGKFEVLDVIGTGGAGVVYKVRHRQFDSLRAVKVLATDATKVAIERLRREAAFATGLTHPNIVRVYDLEVLDDGSLAIVMEYLEGVDLQVYVTERGPMTPAQVVEMFAPVAEALDRMHEADVLHRDIKPANLFVCDDGTVKILDLGLSRLTTAVSDLTRDGQIVGTPRYMAPELLEGEPATKASDIHSLGATLFFAVTGQPPFAGSRRTELTRAILDVRRPRASTLDPAVPRRVSGALARAMARRPEGRWSTAADLVEGMDETSPWRGATFAWIWPHRAQALVLALLGVLLVAAGLFAWAPWRGVDPNDRAEVEAERVADPRSPLAVEPTRGGTLRMGLPVDLPSVDPTVAKFESFWGVQFLLYDTLVDVDWTGEILPGLAHRWEVHEDSTRFVFHLREDAVFHDDPALPGPSHALDAEDVRRSLERVFVWIATDSDSTWNYLPRLAGIDEHLAGHSAHPSGLRVLGPSTLEVVFDRPAPSFLQCLRRPLWSVVAAEAIDAYGPADLGYRAVGTGPFRLLSADHVGAVLERHDNAWHRDAQGRPLPYLDRVEVTAFSSALAVSTALREGRIDLVFRRPNRDLEAAFDIQDARALPREGWEDHQLAAYIDEAHRHLSMLLFDKTSDHPFVEDARIRRAIGAAIRRDELTDDPFVPADSPLVDGMLGYEPRSLRDGDLERAARLLEEAGYADASELPPITLCAKIGRRHDAEAVIARLGELSIDVQETYVEHVTWTRYLIHGGCDLVFAVYDDQVVDGDPSDVLRGIASHAAITDRQPPLADVIREIGETSDRQRRAGLCRQLSAALVDDAMILFLGYRSPERPIFRTVAHRHVQGLTDPLTGWMNPRRARMRMLWIEGQEPDP